MTDLPISRQMLRAVAVWGIHIHTDMPGLTRQDAERWMRTRLRPLRGQTVWIGSTYGPQSSASTREHKKSPMRVHSQILRPMPVDVVTLENAIGMLKAAGQLGTVIENASRFSRGLMVPRATEDWLKDGVV